MSNITKWQRERIARNAVASIYQPKKDDLDKRQDDVARKCYEGIFPVEIRKQISKIPKEWLRQDNCLRFNADGWNVILCLSNQAVLPVPYSTNCQNLGSITGTLAEEAKSMQQEKDALRVWYAEQLTRLEGFVSGFKSWKSIQKTWSEGEPFYKSLMPTSNSCSVPAIITDEINSMLGINKKEVK